MGSIETIRNTSSGYWYITNSLTTLMNEIIQDYKDEQAEYNSILQVNSLDYDLDNSSESWIPKIKINITHYETMMNHSTKVPFKEGFK